MTVCRYFLQGRCRFGDRCRFEHTDSNYPNFEDSYRGSHGKRDIGFNDRYRQQDTYHNQNNYQYRDTSSNPRRYGNSNQHFDNKYNQNEYDDYYEQNDVYGSNQRFNDSQSYDSNYRKSAFSNKQNSNRYEWVSDDYKRSQQQQQTYRSNHESAKSRVSFSFKEPDVEEVETDENILILADKVKEDAISWELGNQWPFTCYSPFAKQDCMPGFNDISFEELRYEALKSEKNGSFNFYVETLGKGINLVNSRQNYLKEPSKELLSVLRKMYNGETLGNDFLIEEGFSIANFNVPGINQSSMEHASINILPSQGQNAAATFSFKSIPTSEDTMKNAASAFSFKSIPNSEDTMKNAASAFSFKSIPTSEDTMKNTASAFSFRSIPNSEDTMKNAASAFSFKMPNSDKSSVTSISSDGSTVYTSMDALSEKDKQQFSASTFTLGKIPTVPPPKIMCF